MGAVYALGLGWFAGAFELTALAAQQTLPLGAFAFVLLGLADLLVMGAVAFTLALLVAPLHVVLHKARASTAIALQLTLVGFLLCGFYLWQAAWLIYTDERAPAAWAMAAMPLGFTGMIYFNARFMLRRAEGPKPLGLPWLPTAFGAALALIVLSGLFQGFRDTGGPHALSDDKNVVYVTVDDWRDVPPSIEARFADGVHFDNAVTPSPHTRAAAAALLTGLHPLRHRVLFDDQVLPWNYTTVAETLAAEGYATAAFVSAEELLADSGLQQGFKVYDDDFSPVVSGLLRLNLVGHAIGGRGWSRSSDATVGRFDSWLATKIDFPFFAWIHLPAEGSETALLQVLDAIDPVADETLVVLTATHGPSDGRDGMLFDDRIRIPLLVKLPGVERKNTRVPQQVRLMDLYVTTTTWLGVKAGETEGLDLSGYALNRRSNTMGSSLVGRTRDGRIQLGLRNNGVKFISTVGEPDALLFRLEDDPGETKNLAKLQPEAYEQAERILAPDSIRLEKLTE